MQLNLFNAETGKISGAVEIAPGKSVADLPADKISKICVSDWAPAGDGTFRPVARAHEKLIPMSYDLPGKLGLGVGYNTLFRLARAGFISIIPIAPRRYALNLQSYFDHIQKLKSDPEFWAPNGPNWKRYQEAL